MANSRAAILAGAVQVQGTLLGTGERCGNVNLTTVIGGMQLRGEAEFVPPESLTGLTALAHSAYAAFGLEAPHGTPIVGRAHLAPGPACTAAASARIRAPIYGAIRPGSAPIRSSASMLNREEPTSFCSLSRSAFRSIPRRRRR